jgi:hypothetical protein
MASALFLSKSVRHFGARGCAHELPVRIPPQEIFLWRDAVVRWRRTKMNPGASFLSTFRWQAKRPPQPSGRKLDLMTRKTRWQIYMAGAMAGAPIAVAGAQILVGVLSWPIGAGRFDGDSCGTLVCAYGLQDCAEQPHTEVQVKADPCFDTQSRASATGEGPGSPARMDEIAFALPESIAQWQTPTTASERFYPPFVKQSRRQRQVLQSRAVNARIASIRARSYRKSIVKVS